VPITIGGYANASRLQVTTAFRCAVVLRDLIAPYLLRRLKTDVALQLPRKTEHVLFCPLSKVQADAYRAYLASKDVAAILAGDREALAGIDVLRKIVNHPDLLDRARAGDAPDYGNPERSGKLQVVRRVLSLWAEQGHRCLLFCQTQQMLDIVEDLLMTEQYHYRRMDGTTPVAQRMRLIDEFNDDDANVFCFLLTTKVGGLGVNLTGADRVLLYDPDWNPATDSQARERAWRVGQKREVTVYRLITPGTIEEKVYHRQIYKQHLTDRILRDPKQRRVFKAKDLADLFTFDEQAATSGGSAARAPNGATGNGAVAPSDARLETAELFAHVDAVVHADAGAIPPGGATAAGDEADMLDSDSDGAEPAAQAANDNGGDDNAHILASLFSSNGIARAMDHDAMATAGSAEAGRAGGNSLIVEAQRVADRASAALAASRAARAQLDVSVPTWTGRNGTGGAPPGAGGVGVTALGGMPSSADLLARARARATAASASSYVLCSHQSGACTDSLYSSSQRLLVMTSCMQAPVEAGRRRLWTPVKSCVPLLCVKWPPFCGCAAGEPPASRSCPNLMAVSTLRKQRHSRLRCGRRRCWRRKALSRPGSSRLSIEARRRHSETLANALRTAHACATLAPTQPRVAVRHNPLGFVQFACVRCCRH
jgi:DNA excision repair protein ERCC-6